MTHCVRPKSSRKFRKCVPAGLERPESHGFCLALKSPRTKLGNACPSRFGEVLISGRLGRSSCCEVIFAGTRPRKRLPAAARKQLKRQNKPFIRRLQLDPSTHVLFTPPPPQKKRINFNYKSFKYLNCFGVSFPCFGSHQFRESKFGARVSLSFRFFQRICILLQLHLASTVWLQYCECQCSPLCTFLCKGSRFHPPAANS